MHLRLLDMNKQASFELSTSLIVKMILGLVMILIILSFFTKFIPFLYNQPVLGKIVMVFSIITLYVIITDVLIKMNLS